jgi:TolA-binding protein
MESDVTQSAAFYKTWAWVDAHRKQVLLGVGAVLIVGCGAGVFIWAQKQKQITASEALSRITIQNSVTGKPAAPEAYRKIADDYAGTSAGERALLMAGSRFFNDGKYAEAQAQFQEFLSRYQSSEFIGQALIGVAAALEAQGKTPEAIKAYKDIVDRHSTSSVMPQARLALGRLYEGQGNLTQAREVYQQLARPDYGSIGQEAAMRLQTLLTQNPALTQPAAPSNNIPVLNLK